MPTIHLQRSTTATPEQYVAGLTDFGPGRSKLVGNSADAYLKVHHRGGSHANVTGGSGGIWERLQYDWSDPDRVVARLDAFVSAYGARATLYEMWMINCLLFELMLMLFDEAARVRAKPSCGQL